ncbi:MAG: response regulator, partial [Rhodospirillaceae bacterium]|nr:response regulator [Rhodospirillaceae bacterium]
MNHVLQQADTQAGTMPARKRVFMVDANPNRASKLNVVLNKLYSVHTFSDGGAALEAMEKEPPHLVLIDETTLSTRGQGIYKTKVRDRFHKFIPFIILSNNMEGPLVVSDRDGAPDYYLKRPFSTNSLLEQILSSLSYSVERSWTKLPKRAQTTLKTTLQDFNKISEAIASGQPVDVKATHKSCRPLVECVQANEYKGVLDGVRKHHNYTYVHSLRVATYLTVFG